MIGVNLKGRLGNQMFQYAILRLVSKKQNLKYTFTKNWLGKDIFDINYGLNENKVKLKLFNEGLNKYNPDVFNISDNTQLNGFWQSEKYFEDNEDFVKNIFKIKPIDFEPNINNIFCDDYCVIHFRGGDYKSHNYIPSKTWYDNSKKYIKAINNDIKFVVITDDIKLAKHFFPSDEILTNNMITDFHILLKSHTKIISSSTFSWWASWLGNNDKTDIIVAPNKWLNHNNQIKKVNGFYPFDIQTKNFIYI